VSLAVRFAAIIYWTIVAAFSAAILFAGVVAAVAGEPMISLIAFALFVLFSRESARIWKE
jgi:hypothetical protein